MLGKLIKNEFINRGKMVLLELAALIGFAIVVAILWTLSDWGVDNGFFIFFLYLSTIAFSIMTFVVFISLFTYSIKDFGNRLFKDQGYLTHTLPVKTSSIILARMVFDVTLIIAIAVIFPLAGGIAARDFSVFSVFFGNVEEWVDAISSGIVSGAVVVVDLILTLVLFLIGGLSSLWLFNAAYAIGHSFNKSKRSMSVVAFVIITIINWVVIYILGYILTETGVGYAVSRSLWYSSYEMEILVSLLFMCICLAASVVIYAVITNYVCKKKLNIE